MATFPATNLVADPQQIDNTNVGNVTVTLTWSLGTSNAGEVRVGQALEITTDSNFTGSNITRYPLNSDVVQIQPTGLPYNTRYIWRVVTYFSGSITQYSSAATFLTLSGTTPTDPPVIGDPPTTYTLKQHIIPSPPSIPSAKIHIVPPMTGSGGLKNHIVPVDSGRIIDRTNGGAPNPTPNPSPGGTVLGDGALICAREAIKWWNRDASIAMVAIAGAESGWDENNAGDDYRNYDIASGATGSYAYYVSSFEKSHACNFYWSWGWYQINMNAHYDKLQAYTGSTDSCVWASWLSSGANNTRIANDVSSGGTYFVPWTMYINGGYQAFLGQATEAVDIALSGG